MLDELYRILFAIASAKSRESKITIYPVGWPKVPTHWLGGPPWHGFGGAWGAGGSSQFIIKAE